MLAAEIVHLYRFDTGVENADPRGHGWPDMAGYALGSHGRLWVAMAEFCQF